MKKYLIIVPVLCLCIACIKSSYGQDLKTEKIAEVDILLDPPIAAGSKAIFPVKGGTITGKINGKFLPAGADYGAFVSSTTYKLDVREIIQTADSATIYVVYTGYIHADAETFGLLASGKAKEISADKYYFRIVPVFETTDPRYEWLNHTAFAGTGVVTETGVSYKIYAIK